MFDISVVIPAFNCEKYICQCLDSLVSARANALSVAEVSIIIVNDSSTDHTSDILKTYSHYDFISIITNLENQGQILSTNIGVLTVTTKWVQIFHSDDFVAADHFLHLSAMESVPLNDNPALLVVERQEVDSNGQSLGELAPLFDQDCSIPGYVQADIFLRTGFLPCQVAFKSDHFRELSGLEPLYEINLDGLLWFKMCSFGDIRYSQKSTSFYRRHVKSVTAQANESCLQIFEYYSTLKRMASFTFMRQNSLISPARYLPSLVRYTIKVARQIASSNSQTSHDYLCLAELLLKSLPSDVSRLEIKQLSAQLSEARRKPILKSELDRVRNFSYNKPPQAISVSWT